MKRQALGLLERGIGRVVPLVAACALVSCNYVDAPLDRAESVAVLSAPGGLVLDPGGRFELAAQAQNADSEAVDGVKIFFLISDTTVLNFAERTDTDFMQETTKPQEAGGVKVSGAAKVALVARDDAGGKTAKVLVGLASPPDTSPESALKTVEVRVTDSEDPDGGAAQ